MQLWPLTVMNSETPETITVKAYIISIIKMLFIFFSFLITNYPDVQNNRIIFHENHLFHRSFQFI
jgi:hypothetical protein